MLVFSLLNLEAGFNLENFLDRFRIPLALVLSVCAVLSGYLFFQKNQQGEEDIRMLTQEEIQEIKNINQAGLDSNIITIDIEGQVAEPGVYEIEEGVSLIEAIEAAGGFTENADLYHVHKNMNLAKLIEDREKIYIPSIQESQLVASPASSVGLSAVGGSSSVVGKVNINTATQAELETLPGVGPSTAEKIVQARPYLAIEQIMDVPGIGEATFEKLRDFIAV